MRSILFIFYFGITKNLRYSDGINFIDLPVDEYDPQSDSQIEVSDSTLSKKSAKDLRKYYLVNEPETNDDDKDDKLKSKITMLVEQTLHDTERKIKSLQNLKDQYRNEAPYKIGFILSMVKKSKDVLSELFNVAVKHKEDWKALEQLKVFELIVHTNVDTTNLVRQLVEVHIQYLNATQTEHRKNRVVLLK